MKFERQKECKLKEKKEVGFEGGKRVKLRKRIE